MVAAALGGGLATATPAAVAGATTPGPGRASGFFTYLPEAAQGGLTTTADRSPGFDVVIEPGTPHVARMVPALRYAVGQLRRYGIDARFGGIAARPINATPAPGDIEVTETLTGAGGTCFQSSGSEAGTAFEASTVPTLQDVGVATQVDGAVVTFCPLMWSNSEHYVTAVAMHELGHAVGLGHYPGRFDGRVQVMNPFVPDVTSYQDGDVAGLRYLAAQTARLRAESRLAGAVEVWRVAPAGLRFSGWAVVGRTSEFATVTVTRDGRAVYSINTSTSRPDIVARTHTGWPRPGFDGARAPMLTGRHTYCIVASVPGIASQRRTLGCRVLGYPPPDAPSSHPAAHRTLTRVPVVPAVLIVLAGAAAVLLLAVVTGWLAVRRRRRPGG